MTGNKLSQADHWRCPSGQAVYITNLKCASSYVSQTLEINNWKMIPYDSVDWNNDFVWSTIIDPYDRYCKGLCQDIKSMSSSFDLWKTLPSQFWQEVGWLGVHSMPISYVFGDKTHLINWVPIDTNNDWKTLINIALQEQNTTVSWDIKKKINQSTVEEKEFTKFIKEKCQGHVKFDFLHNCFPDYQIYQQSLELCSHLAVPKPQALVN